MWSMTATENGDIQIYKWEPKLISGLYFWHYSYSYGPSFIDVQIKHGTNADKYQ